MFCPLCRAEYREGFYRCADCDVALVHSLSDVRQDFEGSVRSEPADFVVAWRGRDPVEFGRIVAALRDADIPSHVVTASEVTLSEIVTMSRFEIRVLPQDRVAAERVVARVGECLADAREQSGQGKEPQEPSLAADWSSEANDPRNYDWEPDDATLEIWSGEDGAIAEFLRDSFREHEIGYRTTIDGNHQRIWIAPRSEEPARRVIRQVLEGPPAEEVF